MKFRTVCPLPSYPFILSPTRPVITLGSCFAANIAARMTRCLWKVLNPGGTLFNPASVSLILRNLIHGNHESEFKRSIFSSDGIFRSWWGDTSLTAATPEEVEAEFSRRKKLTASMLREAEAMFVTFGTAWIYELAGIDDYVVANCHKQPACLFKRRRLSVDEIVGDWSSLLAEIESLFKNLKVIFTVSPVRHIKDGLEGNNRSKAILMLAVEELCQRAPNAFYFPAYEIVADDLRDYRFYASDLVHPSDQAVDYIWEKFQESLLDEAGRTHLREGEAIARGWLHHPLAGIDGKTPEAALLRDKKRREQILDRYALFVKKAAETSGTACGVQELSALS